jgi:calcineurin-like phosphoesterase family protein
MIYFTADTHFGHANIIKYCNRPFNSVEEMDRALIRNWNETVQPDDDIYILGDFTMRGEGHAKAYLTALNGKKYFIIGNHDEFLEEFGETAYWFEWVKDYAVIEFEGSRFVLFHYPIVEWHGFGKGSIHLHGHLHNSASIAPWLSSNTRVFNVGVDVCDYKPISVTEIIRRASKIAITKRHGED